ncbi:MAG: hypothetical protein ACI9J3_003514 [Parvicellaceae bacterium]|jgi:hypothetical protein
MNKKGFKLITFLTVLTTVFTIAGCSNPNQTDISNVETMQSELNGYETMVSELDADQIRDMQHEYGTIMNVINAKYVSDSVTGLDQKFGRMTNLYKGVKRSKGFGMGKENVLEEIAYSKTQLENLLDDLQNQDITNADTVKYFVELEQKSLSTIKLVAEKLQLNFDILMGVQDSVYPYMQGIVDSLNRVK